MLKERERVFKSFLSKFARFQIGIKYSYFDVSQWRSQRGQGGDRPLAETLPPLAPKWNYTLYRGLWRAAILSPSQPPCSPLSPLAAPHFEKSGYAPDVSLKYLLYYYSKLQVHLHRQSLLKISVNFFNLIFNDKTRISKFYEGVELLKHL